jgi:hypothetical protein
LSVKGNSQPTAEIDKRFVEYLLELSDGVSGRIFEVFRRAAFQALVDKSSKVELLQLQHVGARNAIPHRVWISADRVPLAANGGSGT